MAIHSSMMLGMALVVSALAMSLVCSAPSAAGLAAEELRIAISPDRELLFQLAKAEGERLEREGMAEYYRLDFSAFRCSKLDGGGLRCLLSIPSGEEVQWDLGSSEAERRWGKALWFFRDIRRDNREDRLAGRFSIRSVALNCWQPQQGGNRECGIYFSAHSDYRDRINLRLPDGSVALEDFVEFSERAGVVGKVGLVAERHVRPVWVKCLERDGGDSWYCTFKSRSGDAVQLELDLTQDAHFKVLTVLDRFQDATLCRAEWCQPGEEAIVNKAMLNCYTIAREDLRGCEIIMLRSSAEAPLIPAEEATK